jgi:hypothetical protein
MTDVFDLALRDPVGEHGEHSGNGMRRKDEGISPEGVIDAGEEIGLAAFLHGNLHTRFVSSRPRVGAESTSRGGYPGTLLHRRKGDQAAALMSIFFAGFCASAFFGSVTVSTPFLKLASILSVSTPSGTRKKRWNDP